MSTGVDKQAPRSLVYGLQLLTLFTAEHPVRSISELAELMGVSRPTAHRYATTCLELGYLEQAPRRRYRLAERSARLGRTMLDSLAIARCAAPVMRRLREASGRTVSLAVLDGRDVIYLQRLRGYKRGQYELEHGIGAGSRRPAEATAAGRALLAAKRDRAGPASRTAAGAGKRERHIEIHPLDGTAGCGLASAIEQIAALEITAPAAALGDPRTSVALARQLCGAAAELGKALAARIGDETEPAG